MMKISVELCRSVENLHGDVLCLNRRSDVEDPTKVVILVVVFKLLAVKIQPLAPLTAVEQLEEGTEKVY